MPFFDTGSVLAILRSGMRFFTWAAELSLFVALAAGLCFVSLRAATSNLSLSPQHPSQTSRSVLHDGRKHKTVVVLQSTTVRKEAAYKFPLFAIGCRGWLQTVYGERQTSPFQRRHTKLKQNWKIAQSCRSPTVSARLRYHVSIFVHRTGTLTKEYPLSKLFSKAEMLPFEKEKHINLTCSSCLKHASEISAARWSTAGWTGNAKLQLLHRRSSISRSRVKLLVFTCLHESVVYSPLSAKFWH